MNRIVRWTFVGLVGMWLVGGQAAALAQEQVAQEQAADQPQEARKPAAAEMAETQAMMEQMMVPMMGQMMSVMLESMAETLARKGIAENLATFARNYYQALLNRGFTEEEALRIVTSMGFPTAGGKQ